MNRSLFIITVVGIVITVAQNMSAQEIFDAVHSGELAKVKELVEDNPQIVKESNARPSTPLHVATDVNNESIAGYLIEKGADLNARTIDGKTPYHLAVEAKKDETAAYLKSIGADQSPQSFPVLKGEYLGQPKPGKKAVPFALGIISEEWKKFFKFDRLE